MASKFLYPQPLIERARLIYSRGYSPREIVEHLRDEGYRVPQKTIANWVYGATRIRP